MQYWAGLKLNSSIFFGGGGGGGRGEIGVLETKVSQDTLCLSFPCNLIGYFEQALKSD